MRMDARRATKVVARLRPVSRRPACGSSRTSSAPCYQTQSSAPLPAPRCARPSPGRTTKPRSATMQTAHFAATRRDGARLGSLLCRSACQGGQPFAAPRFACALADRRASERAQGSERSAASGSHCRGSACGGAIPESHRRNSVGLNQRFPNAQRVCLSPAGRFRQ